VAGARLVHRHSDSAGASRARLGLHALLAGQALRRRAAPTGRLRPMGIPVLRIHSGAARGVVAPTLRGGRRGREKRLAVGRAPAEGVMSRCSARAA